MSPLRIAPILLILVITACRSGTDPKDSVVLDTPPPEPPADMVYVPAGSTFALCDEHPEDGCPLEVSAFFIDRLEVNISDYKRCSEAGSCEPITHLSSTCDYHTHVRGESVERPELHDLPATCIDRPFAEQYCAWVQKRLPTGPEWIRAAHGDDHRAYPWGDTEPTCDSAAICRSPTHTHWPHPVGSHPEDRSPFGALDMAGNVCELTTDGWYGGTYLHGLRPEELRSYPNREEYVLYGHSGFRCARDTN